MLAHATRRRGERNRWGVRSKPVCVAGIAEQLPLASASIDLVFCNLMLHWCNDPDAVFAECQRVLKPGGLLMPWVAVDLSKEKWV